MVDDLAEAFADEGAGKTQSGSVGEYSQLGQFLFVQFVFGGGFGGVGDECLAKRGVGVETGKEGLGGF